ncbi:MAG: aminoglycoside phosphotransferase family protein, partial [Planctomycetota bacterium]
PQTEVRFYAEVAARVPVPRPRVLAATRRFGRGYTLVLGDLAEAGFRPGRAEDALSPAQAGAVVDLLADLHARFWEDPSLSTDLAWLGGPVRRLEDGLGTALARPLMRRGLARAGEAVPPALHAPALRYAARRRAAMRRLHAGPRTLTHHDCHPGNLYWSPDGPGLLDWQLVRVGEGVGDVAYLLACGLDPVERRAHERELLGRYAKRLARGGVRADPDALYERYRAHTVYAFEAMVVTLAVGDMMDEGAARALVRRAAQAAADLDAFAAASG